MRIGTGIGDAQWYRIILRDDRSLIGDEARIRDLFDRSFANREKPFGMSLWLERRDDGSAIYYLSPASVTIDPGLAQHLGAVRSTQPSASAYFIAGHEAAGA